MSQPPRAEGEKAKDRWADLPQVDVEKMDYEYVGKCEDAKELLDIYTVLTSGKEGRYFDLEKYTEERMLKFMAPKERKLWLARTTEPSQEEKAEAALDLSDWAESIGNTDKALRGNGDEVRQEMKSERKEAESVYAGENIFGDEDDEDRAVIIPKSASHIPPPRNQVGAGGATAAEAPAPASDSDDDEEMDEETRKRRAEQKKLRYSYDYFKEWDKFDVDGEMDKLDEAEKAEEQKRRDRAKKAKIAEKERKERMERDLKKLGLRSDMLEAMSTTKRTVVAEKEKQKGNECFRSKEFDEAFMYYSRSLFFDSANHIVYANRAMTCLRLKKYEQAENDCTKALEIDGAYVKALSRRGMARHKRGKYYEAVQDFSAALEREPENKELKKLKASSQKMHEEVGGIVTGGKNAPSASGASARKKMSRISIEEVEDEEEDEEDEGTEPFDASLDFVQAASFASRKPGFVFKAGSEGLGYYRDGARKKQASTRIQIVETDEDEDEDEDEEEEKKSTSSSSASPKSVASDGYVHLKSPTSKDSSLSSEEREKAGLEAKAAGGTAFKRGDLDDAYRMFSRAIDLFPSGHEETAKCLNNRALVNMRMGKHQDVVRDCTMVLDDAPENIKALLRRGAAREETGAFQGALDDMCTVMKIDPSREIVSKAISRLLVKIQEAPAPSAEEVAEKKRKEASEKAEKKRAKAAAAEKKRKEKFAAKKAEEEDRAAKKKEKAVAKARAKAEKEKAEKEKAEKERAAKAKAKAAAEKATAAKKALPKLDASKSALNYKDEGNAHFKAGKFHDAVVSYSMALRVDAECLPAISNRAISKLKLKDFSGAVEDCTKGLATVEKQNGEAKEAGAKNRPTQVKLLYRRSLGNKGLGKYEAATADVKAIIAIEPANASALTEQKLLQKLLAPPQNPDTMSRIKRMEQANQLAEKAAQKLVGKFMVPTNPPKSFIEFERVRKELQFDLAKFSEYLLLIKPKSLKTILKTSITEEILSTTIKALASHFIPNKAEKALSFLKYFSKVPRFDTTRMFLGDDEKQMVKSIFAHLASAGLKPETVKSVRKAWKC